MINPLLDRGAEINPFTNYTYTKHELVSVWMLITVLSLSVFNRNASREKLQNGRIGRENGEKFDHNIAAAANVT